MTFHSYTYTRTQQFLPPLWAAINQFIIIATLEDIERKIAVKIKTLTLAEKENERISSRGKKNK